MNDKTISKINDIADIYDNNMDCYMTINDAASALNIPRSTIHRCAHMVGNATGDNELQSKINNKLKNNRCHKRNVNVEKGEK